MSDAPLPLESYDRDAQPAQSAALPLGQAGGSADAQDASANDSVKDEPALASATASDPEPLADTEEASPPPPQVNGSAVGHADPQPAIEPGSPDAPVVSDAAPEIDQSAPPLVLEPAPSPAADPVPEAFAVSPAEHAYPPAGHVPPPAEIVMEVSPIFSALDAAEKVAAEPRREPPPATVPANFTILLPQQPSFGGVRLHAPDPVAAETIGDAAPDPVAAETAGDAAPDPVAAETAGDAAPDPVAAETIGDAAPDPVAAETTGDAAPETEPPPEAADAPAAFVQEVPQPTELLYPEAADAPAAFAQEVPQPAELLYPEAADAPAALAQEVPQPTELIHDAAAKIAEEANATAEALESLKRLLNQKLPLLDPAPISAPAAVAPPPAPRAAAPPSIPAFQLPTQPVKPPPMVPLALPADLVPLMRRAPVRRRLRLGGFFAGFALSWVFGAMLYIYLAVLG